MKTQFPKTLTFASKARTTSTPEDPANEVIITRPHRFPSNYCDILNCCFRDAANQNRADRWRRAGAHVLGVFSKAPGEIEIARPALPAPFRLPALRPGEINDLAATNRKCATKRRRDL
ncbi:hypothetical protein EVAR_27684_1 [Eumeta japonica]|uniref:Uncharacterized protein n=1 Tax=Eumeta variegata TaxID=151549 RepID=A0A4C1WP27_EUMVA|nr:hypothetical protein EVAR_27684_1 [Eumeta japonica]